MQQLTESVIMLCEFCSKINTFNGSESILKVDYDLTKP